MTKRILQLSIIIFFVSGQTLMCQKRSLVPLDVFKLNYVDNPSISPDGEMIAFLKKGYDIMTDKQTSQLWLVKFNGEGLRPISPAGANVSNPVWSPDGERLAWFTSGKDGHQLIMRYISEGEESVMADFDKAPSSLAWSPDGRWLSYIQFVPKKKKSFIDMPSKPEGADWAPAPRYSDDIVYRSDGRGDLPEGYTQVFILSANGGSAVQVSDLDYNVNPPLAWSSESTEIYYSAQDREDLKGDFYESDLFMIDITYGKVKKITEKRGADYHPAICSPKNQIAWLGFSNDYNSHQQMEIYYSANKRDVEARPLTNDVDRSINSIQWNPEGTAIWFSYDDKGTRKVNAVGPEGKLLMDEPISGLSGSPLGRPYSGGSFSVGPKGKWVATLGDASRPAELYAGQKGKMDPSGMTNFNSALFLSKEPAKVEAFTTRSSYDDQEIQGWIVYPPNFDASKKYPMLLEIHGGPHTTYGDFFSMEIQQYANRGYVVVYTNPRGSTSYGREFAQLIQHDYPGKDYDDLMSCVDAVIAKGFIDEERLYVTGGSGGGILTAWIVCKTDRFRAAVSAKPVINWVSEALTSDIPLITKYWFPAMPWENFEAYWKRSPLAYVQNVKTPTLMMVGSLDYRTPLSEAEQFYRALKLNGVETGLVRFPGSSHGIASRPSRMLAKTGAIMGWFEKYGGPTAQQP